MGRHTACAETQRSLLRLFSSDTETLFIEMAPEIDHSTLLETSDHILINEILLKNSLNQKNLVSTIIERLAQSTVLLSSNSIEVYYLLT